MSTTDAGNAPILIHAEAHGEVNREPVAGEGTAQYVPDENIIAARMQFRPLFRSLMMVSSTSIFSVSCSIFSRALFGSVNLASMFEEKISGNVDFRLLNLSGRAPGEQHVVGVVTQEFTLERVGSNDYRFHTTLSGWHSHPPEIGTLKSPGYSMHLRQAASGEVEGVYGQVVADNEGDTHYVFSRRKYRYEGPATLPYDEVMTYRIIEVNERVDDSSGTHLIDFRSQAYYAPTAHALLY